MRTHVLFFMTFPLLILSVEEGTKLLPPKIGINGFNGVGRLVLRAAMETGLDVRAINDN